MSDMNLREAEIDNLLRQSMTEPVPRLSPDFHQVLSRELRRRSQPLHSLGRILLAGYGGVSAVTSIIVMRSQGLGWAAIAALMFGSLVTLELARRLPRRQSGVAAK